MVEALPKDPGNDWKKVMEKYVTGSTRLVLATLDVVTDFAPIPWLKPAVGAAMQIISVIDRINNNKNASKDLLGRTVDLMLVLSVPRQDCSNAELWNDRPGSKAVTDELYKKLGEVLGLLNGIADDTRKLFKPVLQLKDIEDRIADCSLKVDFAIKTFQIGFAIHSRLEQIQENKKLQAGINKLLLLWEHLDAAQLSDGIVKRVKLHVQIEALMYAERHTWDKELACLQDTRVKIIDDIEKWILGAETPGSSAEVLWLSDAPGSGKSSVAHAIASHCDELGILGSSFFFRRTDDMRNTPRRLFSTMARDLAALDQDISDRMAAAITKNPSLAKAPPIRQFENLILPALEVFRLQPRIVVIVIDGLDESYARDTKDSRYTPDDQLWFDQMMTVLREHVPRLPGVFRIFVTSRPEQEIVKVLSGPSSPSAWHVTRKSLELDSEPNQQDIAMYIRRRLTEIAKDEGTFPTWPDPEQTEKLIKKADGLFIYAATACAFLAMNDHKSELLVDLLKSSHAIQSSSSQFPADKQEEFDKMGELYTTVLNSFKWTKYLKEDYSLLFGSLVVLKTPLSLSALQDLHPPSSRASIHKTCRRLASLLKGIYDPTKPVEFIHLTLREFLTAPDTDPRFRIVEEDHEGRLALLCLQTMNHDLNWPRELATTEQPGAEDFLPVEVGPESEALQYGCKHWMDHLEGVPSPIPEALKGDLDALERELRMFARTKVSQWMEAVFPFITGRQTLNRFQAWSKKFKSEAQFQPYTQHAPEVNITVTQSLLPRHAPQAQSMDSYWECPAETSLFDGAYAEALLHISDMSAYARNHGEAMARAEEAVGLYRQLAGVCPNHFNFGLALSLKQYSLRLYDMGDRDQRHFQDRYEDALEAAREAVKCFRSLAAEDPAAFNPLLALSLSTLCFHLRRHRISQRSDRHTESELIHEEALSLYRPLAETSPETLNPEVFHSVHNLYDLLFALQRPETLDPEFIHSVNNQHDLVQTLQRLRTLTPEALGSVAGSHELRSDTQRLDTLDPQVAHLVDNLRYLMSAARRPPRDLTLIRRPTLEFLPLVGREQTIRNWKPHGDIRVFLVAFTPVIDQAMLAKTVGLQIRTLSRDQGYIDSPGGPARQFTLSFFQVGIIGPNYLLDNYQDGKHLIGEMAEIEERIRLCRHDLSGCPVGSGERPEALMNLGIALGKRYDATEEMDDLEESITYHRECLFLCPVGHPEHATSLNNLSEALISRWQRDGKQEDGKESFDLLQTVLALPSIDKTERSTATDNLNFIQGVRSTSTRKYKDILNMKPMMKEDGVTPLSWFSHSPILGRNRLEWHSGREFGPEHELWSHLKNGKNRLGVWMWCSGLGWGNTIRDAVIVTRET
ncbi:POC1 centriolar protein A [Tulasnella sp. 332]|nr:POC1 centriolar protein A [Tulasnella sp. 332]